MRFSVKSSCINLKSGNRTRWLIFALILLTGFLAPQDVIANHVTEKDPANYSREGDLRLDTKRYIKTIALASETVFGENYFLDLTRARFDLKLRYKKHIAFRAVYDQEALLGDYLKTQEFKQVKDLEPKDFLDLDWTLLDRKNIFWRHSLYRAYGQYKTEKASITVGRQRIAWGTGRLWNPTDLFNPVDPLQLEQDEKRGVDALSFDWFFDDFSFLNLVYAPQRSQEDLKAGIRLKTSLEDWDLSFMGGRFEEDEVIGGDFSTTLFEGGLRGEMTYTSVSGDSNDFLRFVLSYDYTFENSLYFLFEYFYNGGNLPAFDLTTFLQDGIATVQKNFMGLNLGYDITPLIRAETHFIWDVDGKSTFIWPKLIWSVTQNLDATLSGQIYHGNEDSEFGSFSNLYHAELQYFF